MRTSPLSSLDMTHFTMSNGLEEFDGPMDIEGDVAVAEAIQDLRRSQAEIAVIGEVREYLTENRTSMNEVKAMELRARVLDAVTAGQLRVNPASVIGDDSSYNGSSSIQFVDAGLESIPGMITKALKYLKDLIKRGIDFLLGYMRSSKPVILKHQQYFTKVQSIVNSSNSDGVFNFTGQTIKMERGLGMSLYSSIMKGPARTITGTNVFDHLQNVEYGVRSTGRHLLGGGPGDSSNTTGLISYANNLTIAVMKDYGNYGTRQQTCCLVDGRVSVSLSSGNGRSIAVIPDYGNIGMLTIVGAPKEVLGYVRVDSAKQMIVSLGRSFADIVSSGKIEPSSVSAPDNKEQAIGIINRIIGLLDVIDDGIDLSISNMQGVANIAIRELEYSKKQADADYTPDTILALTSCVSMVLAIQSWRIKTVGAVSNAVQGYFKACMI